MLSCAKWFVIPGVLAAQFVAAQSINLSTSKQILEPVPGSPVMLNSLPMGLAWSPDHRYLALVNSGFGTAESNYSQSIAIVDTARPGTADKSAVAAKVSDFPDQRTFVGSAQTMYSGIAFSLDGTHLYVSLDSLTAPEGGEETHRECDSGVQLCEW